MSDRMYINEYKFLSDNDLKTLKPLNQLKIAKLKYLPFNVNFSIKDKDNQMIETYKVPENLQDSEHRKPLNLVRNNPLNLLAQYPRPLIAGARYPVSLAVAKTLEVVDTIIQYKGGLLDKILDDFEYLAGSPEFDNAIDDYERFLVTAVIKHGADGMGGLKVWRKRSEEKRLPDKGFHYSLTIVERFIQIRGKTLLCFMKMTQILLSVVETYYNPKLMKMIKPP